MVDSSSGRLEECQQQIIRKKHLEAVLADLDAQKGDLEVKVQELNELKQDEQEDVERLEGRSLAAFFYSLIGKMDEKLSKEREEAYAAEAKYDAAVSELTAVTYDIQNKKKELQKLEGCEEAYSRLLYEKTEAIKASGSQTASEIFKIEGQIAQIAGSRKEIGEAIHAGQKALFTAECIMGELESAENWGTWDLFGGGLVADIAKHSHLDDAQGQVEQLQVELRRFKTELADVTIYENLQVNIDGFLRFADYFFDGIFADWSVLDRIGQSKQQVKETKKQIEMTLDKLNRMNDDAEKEEKRLNRHLERLVVEENGLKQGI